MLAIAAALSLAGGWAEAQAVPDGILWSTYLGGSGTDAPAINAGASMLPNGDIVVAGSTDSTDFPVRAAWQSAYGGPASPVLSLGDGFAARLRADCGGLEWSTYLGGSGQDAITGVAVDGSGCVLVCGVTWSTDFPTTAGAFMTAPGGMADGFVARFAWDGQQLRLLWSTYLGGSGEDSVTGIALDASGSVVVSGATRSPDFPMRGTPYQGSLAGGYDAFVAVLDPTGGKLLASTYLGGSGDDSAQTWVAAGYEVSMGATVALDHAGNPVLAFYTTSTDCPTTPNAWSPAYRGGSSDCVVVRLNRTLSRLTYCTYLGGSRLEAPVDKPIVTPEGYIVVATVTGSADFPTTPGCLEPTLRGNCANLYGDGTVTVLDTRTAGSAQLVYSSFIGGTGCDGVRALTLDRQARLLVAGFTRSANSPTSPGAFQRFRAGQSDSFVMQLDYRNPALAGPAQLRYGTYLGGTCTADEGITAILPDEFGDVTLVGGSPCTDFPKATTSGCGVQPGNAGGFDVVLTKASLLPRGVERFGRSTPACLEPMHQTVNSWPIALNQSFRIEVLGAPPNANGIILFGLPDPPGTLLNAFGIDCFVLLPQVASVTAVADHLGYAHHSVPIPAVTPSTPPHGIATQWFFLTSPTCPGIGPLGSSEGLRF